MKRSLWSGMLTVAGVAILSIPRSADACSRCDPERPRCLPAVNLRCGTYAYSKTVVVCEEFSTSCAYAYAPDEISADGSIARLAAAPDDKAGAEQTRGCHGLILDRAYSGARRAQARAGSHRILL